MIGVEYAIPSRARAETLSAKTLALLRRLDVSPDRISVYVADDERDAYTAALAGSGVSIRPGAAGMAAQRRAILDAYPPGTPVVSIDDDIRDLVIRRSEQRLEPISPGEWADVVRMGFYLAADGGPRLWGLYPVPNPYFMKPKIRVGLSYVGGGCFGYISEPSAGSPLAPSLDDKEDFERSLQCYAADGAVARFDYVSWKTQGYAGAGGMQDDGLRTADRIRGSAETLAARFPDLATLNLSKKSGHAELRLRDRRAA